MEYITILICLWAIGLEYALRKREGSNEELVAAIRAIADGKAKIAKNDGKITITYKINKESK